MVKGSCCFGVPFWLYRSGLFGGHPTLSLTTSHAESVNILSQVGNQPMLIGRNRRRLPGFLSVFDVIKCQHICQIAYRVTVFGLCGKCVNLMSSRLCYNLLKTEEIVFIDMNNHEK